MYQTITYAHSDPNLILSAIMDSSTLGARWFCFGLLTAQTRFRSAFLVHCDTADMDRYGEVRWCGEAERETVFTPAPFENFFVALELAVEDQARNGKPLWHGLSDAAKAIRRRTEEGSGR